MVRQRRKCGVRKTMECFRRCLNNIAFSHVIKWKDKEKKIFTVLYKHKKSPQWTSKYLVLFKELDKITKSEKYENQKDSEKTGKQRCRANLKKLCDDGLLEYVGENKLDKSTREVDYKIIEASSNDQTNFETKENEWIDKPFVNIDGDSVNNHFSSNMALQTINRNNDAENIDLSDWSNTSAGNDAYNEESEVSSMDNCLIPDSQTNDSNESNVITGIDSNLNAFSNAMDLEDYLDLKDLVDMVEVDKVIETSDEDILLKGCFPN